MYSIAQVERDIKSLPGLILVVLGAALWAWHFVPAGEEALPISVIQSVAIIAIFLGIAAVMIRRENPWVRRMGLLPVLLGFLTALMEANYYLIKEFEKGNNFTQYLVSGNTTIAGEIIIYGSFLAAFAVISFFISLMKGSPAKRV